MMETTAGFLLGGRVRYAQPVQGYRTGIEPVLLAASIPAQPGQRVLEAGTGAGAALLCLHARVPGLSGIGIEKDPGMADLARQNLADNGAPFSILTADITEAPPLPPFDHVFANPPWHDPASTRPPNPRRDAATHQAANGLANWTRSLAALMAPKATLTLILPAALAAEAIATLHATGLRRQTLLPLWPRQNQPAKIVVLQATLNPGPARIAPGLTLHEGAAYSPETEQVLRHGASLPL
jgi:tRNA1(Val) A37 N6-methylase TrmN6